MVKKRGNKHIKKISHISKKHIKKISTKKRITKKRTAKKLNRVYSIQSFWLNTDYEQDTMNWYYDNYPDYLLRKNKDKLFEAFRRNIDKISGNRKGYTSTAQYQEAEYFFYYKIYKTKRKLTRKYQESLKNKIGLIRLQLAGEEDEDRFDRLLKTYRLTKKYNAYKKRITKKRDITTYDIFVFLTREIAKKQGLRRINKKWTYRDYRYLTLKR